MSWFAMQTDEHIELRSDTFSLPYDEMYEALGSARLGDDVYEEDETVIELERRAAELTGKEKALLVTSGSQGNLCALLSQTRPGDEVVIGANTSFLNWETSGITAVGGVLPRPLEEHDGAFDPDEVRTATRTPNLHNGNTALVALENSHEESGGTPISPARVAEVAEAAREGGARVHVDGARLMNAAVALGVPAAELVAPVDTVTFCLSKGLCCPAGSVLCGDAETIERARQMRKMLGGGMRQAGWIAAPALVALENIDRLAEDHANARRLADALERIPAIDIDPDRTRTNIVYFDLRDDAPLDADQLTTTLWANGVRALPMAERTIRMVVHRTITSADVDATAALAAQALAGELAGATS